MTPTQTTVCEFCNSLNPSGSDNCTACGAPLPEPRPSPATAQPTAHTTPAPGSAVEANRDLQQARAASAQVEDIGRKALYAYSLLWRSLAEAAAVAFTAFALGLTGGLTGTSGWAVPGAVLVGIGVGFTIKSPLRSLLSAPVGMLAGALAGGLFYMLGAGVWVFPAGMSAFAFLAALLGGSSIRGSQVNIYEKLRPMIGALGGFLFGLVGMLLGLALRAAVGALPGS